PSPRQSSESLQTRKPTAKLLTCDSYGMSSFELCCPAISPRPRSKAISQSNQPKAISPTVHWLLNDLLDSPGVLGDKAGNEQNHGAVGRVKTTLGPLPHLNPGERKYVAASAGNEHQFGPSAADHSER